MKGANPSPRSTERRPAAAPPLAPRRRVAARGLGFACCLLLGLSCAASRNTQRMIVGETVDGPYIQPEAYAAHAEGSYLEARGDWRAAEQAYLRALQHDGDSPSLWTRLGAIRCRTGLQRGIDAFDEATATEYAPAWAELGRCRERHGQKEKALEAARRAILIDPLSSEANLLMARLYRQQGKPELARAWLFAWLLISPEAASNRGALDELATELGDAALARLALSERERQTRLEGSELTERPPSTRKAPAATTSRAAPRLVEAALWAGDLAAARVAAAQLGLGATELALLALESGRPELALTQAELVLGANPGDADAAVTALFATSLLGDAQRFRALLLRVEVSRTSSAAVAPLMTELLAWWAGDDASGAWRAASPGPQPRPPRAPRAAPARPPAPRGE